jgi:hypothetical protein
MSVTITRTAWIDDDGTGTTGTVINNAVKTDLYNQIDGALAKVAQLTGGNTFSGDQSISGRIYVNFAAGTLAQVCIASNQMSYWGLEIHTAVDQPNGWFVALTNAAGSAQGSIAAVSAVTTAFNTTSDQRLKRDGGPARDVGALRAVVVHDFEWTTDGSRDRGVFAQEAHAHYPRAVFPGSDDTTETGALARPWMTDYSKFVPDLIVGWQHHDAALAELRATIATLKGSPDAE